MPLPLTKRRSNEASETPIACSRTCVFAVPVLHAGVCALLCLAACGRIHFAPSGDAGDADANRGADGVDGPGDGAIGDGIPTLAGLVAWFSFNNDPSATSVRDDVSGALGLCTPPGCPTATNATAVDGISYIFDGVDDCIYLPDAPRLRVATFTLSVWTYQQTSSAMTVLSKRLASNNSSWLLASLMSDSMLFLYNVGANDIGSPGTPVKVTLGVFQHRAVTYDPVLGYEMFLDGVSAYRSSPGTGTVVYDANTASIGCTDHASSSNYFDGVIDEVQIYDRVLTPPEIQQLATTP